MPSAGAKGPRARALTGEEGEGGVRPMRIAARMQRLLGSEDGATAIEYALMVALIAMVIIAAVAFLGQSTNLLYQDVGNAVSST